MGVSVIRYNEIYKVQMRNIPPHVCRHTYCSNMAKSGMNPKTLQYLMRHSDIAVTLNVYTHVGLEDAEKELQKMQGLENARKEMGISDMDDKPLKQRFLYRSRYGKLSGVLLFDQDDNIYSVPFMRRCFRNVLFQYARNCMQLFL